jgi:hypothetical protein
MLRRTAIASLLVLLVLGGWPGSSAAGPGGILATGWNGVDEPDYLKGTGKGVYVFGGASTVYRWSALRSADDEVVKLSPLWQLFRFSVRDNRSRHRVSFETSVRGSTDLDRGGFRGEVLYAFVELAPEGRWASARIGRQLVTSGGADGLIRMDGLSSRLTLRYLSVESFAGVQLRSRAFVVPQDERETHQTGWGQDWTWGVALATAGLPETRIRLGLLDRYRSGSLARRHLTLDGWQGILGMVQVRGNLSVDLLQRRLHEVLVGVDVRPVHALRLGAEYERWQPSFDAGELFSVFATDPYDSVRGWGDVRIGEVVDVWAGGGVQIYPDAVTRDDVPWKELGSVSGSERVGVRVRPVRSLAFSVEERLVDGTGGRKLGISVTARATPWQGALNVGIRGDFQIYDFDLQPLLTGQYGGAALDVAVQPVPWLRVGVRGEAIFSPWLKNDFQVAATLDLLLGIKHLGRDAAAQARLQDHQPGLLASSAPRARSPFRGLGGGIGLGGDP